MWPVPTVSVPNVDQDVGPELMGRKALTRKGNSAVPKLHGGNRPRDNASRPTASQRGYGVKWQRERDRYLADHPACALCQRDGRHVEATVVDHIEPVASATDSKFWRRSNWQPLCRDHHAAKTADDKRRGLTRR